VAPSADRSDFRLTQQQLGFFDANGYLVLRNWMPGPVLERVQAASEVWMETAHRVGPDHPHPRDFQFGRPGGRRSLFKVEYLHDKGEAASLELLGSPAVLEVAQSLCGPDFVPTFEALVVKQVNGGANVPWHQDAVHPRTARIFNYGLYLDHSRDGEGALRVIPGSHRQAQDICGSASVYGWEPPGAVTLEVGPGDVLLHDVMLVHGSPQVTSNRLRRTVYLEFRAARQILDEGPWDRRTIDGRLRLLPLALSLHRTRFPGLAQFTWRVSDELRPRVDGEDLDLRLAHTVTTPGTYCSAGNATGSRVVRAGASG
jgi:hypothetical protein